MKRRIFWDFLMAFVQLGIIVMTQSELSQLNGKENMWQTRTNNDGHMK
jgi:hypothetical protein